MANVDNLRLLLPGVAQTLLSCRRGAVENSRSAHVSRDAHVCNVHCSNIPEAFLFLVVERWQPGGTVGHNPRGRGGLLSLHGGVLTRRGPVCSSTSDSSKTLTPCERTAQLLSR